MQFYIEKARFSELFLEAKHQLKGGGGAGFMTLELLVRISGQRDHPFQANDRSFQSERDRLFQIQRDRFCAFL